MNKQCRMSRLNESVISSLSRCRLAEASLKNVYFRREDNEYSEEKSFLRHSPVTLTEIISTK